MIEWRNSRRLCCSEDVLNGMDAVKVFDKDPDTDLQLEIALPNNCKRGFFIESLNRRLCPLHMTDVKELQACCEGGTPRFGLEELSRIALVNKDQLIVQPE
ncbi:hypothetical protein Ddc_04471 [Ditylenchus destructor]|nr:hypothetical protein Ddc_04471 [Ditylenchus destructor]